MHIYEIEKTDVRLSIDDEYRKMHSLPDDPEYMRVYGKETENAACLVMIQPVPHDGAMPYEHPQTVIDGIHECLKNDQGLVEVSAGKTKSGRRYIYSIIKTAKEPSGVQYTLCMHLEYGAAALNIQGYFDETEISGMRDAAVFNALRKEDPSRDIENWNYDPYDPAFKRGLLFNRSEEPRYDRAFPLHPLSEARRFVSRIVGDN